MNALELESRLADVPENGSVWRSKKGKLARIENRAIWLATGEPIVVYRENGCWVSLAVPLSQWLAERWPNDMAPVPPPPPPVVPKEPAARNARLEWLRDLAQKWVSLGGQTVFLVTADSEGIEYTTRGGYLVMADMANDWEKQSPGLETFTPERQHAEQPGGSQYQGTTQETAAPATP